MQKKGFGPSEFLVGTVIAGFGIGWLVFHIPSAFLVGRLGVNKIIKIGLTGLVLPSVIAGFAPDFWVLLGIRFAEGMLLRFI